MCPHSTTTTGSQAQDRAGIGERPEIPQFIYDLMETLARRAAPQESAHPGSSYAERHLYDTGHRLRAGCCAGRTTGEGDDAA